MIHFLRDEHNRTIVECEVTKNDLHAVVDIEVYSEILLDIASYDIDNVDEWVSDISSISEIRGWFWEGGYEKDHLEIFVKEVFTSAAKKWELNYVTD